MKWRVTYVEGPETALEPMMNLAQGRILFHDARIESSPRMELRASNGAIIRLGRGAEFSIIDSPFGEAPETYGEVFVSRENPHKYRTSCWTGRSPSSASIDYFVKPVAGSQSDQYFAVIGDMIVFEFDQDGKAYDIVSIPEGTSAVVSYATDSNGRKSYTAQRPTPIRDADYDYLVANYLDPRRWR